MRRELLLLYTGSLFACCLFPRDYGGDPEESIEIAGLARTYRVHVPPAVAAGTPAPVVFLFHGGGGSGAQIASYTNFSALADREGFIAVYPDGIDGRWYDGRRPEHAHWQDEAFVRALLDRVSARYAVDPDRVFGTGISNGGMLSQYLAVHLSDRFAAFASLTASLPERVAQDFRPRAPVSMMVINGVEDPLVPYAGGEVGRNLGKVVSTDETIRRWAEFNACREGPLLEDLPDSDPDDRCRAQRKTWTGGRKGTEVVLIRIDGGGHTWPGATQYLPKLFIGRLCRDFDATEEVWKFLKAHPRRP